MSNGGLGKLQPPPNRWEVTSGRPNYAEAYLKAWGRPDEIESCISLETPFGTMSIWLENHQILSFLQTLKEMIEKYE